MATPEVEAAQAAERERLAQLERRRENMYPNSIDHDASFKRNMPRLGDRFGLTPAQQVEMHKSAVRTLRVHRINGDTIGRVLDVHADLKLSRGTEEEITAQVNGWSEISRRRLREQYGAEKGAQLLRRAQHYIKKHPDLAALMADGVGSHPDVVLGLVQRFQHEPDLGPG